MNSVLSGEQLVQAHSKTNYELPTAGLKDFQPNNSWLEQKQIESALQERKALLEEERVEKWSCLMSAEWVAEKRKACVKQKNKHWEVFGHHSAADDTDWLFPEETLFLMEINCLECLYGEVPLSVQKGYSVLLGPENGCSLVEYRVFAHLCRTGYRVVRHLPELTVTAYERQIRLDQHLDQKKSYDEDISEPVIMRPDLPPKKVVELSENAEMALNSASIPLSSEDESSPEMKNVKTGKQTTNLIEIIDIADTSSEESASSESSEEDSDVEIIEVFEPARTFCDNAEEEENEEEDNDIEIIELSVPKKEIVVATIESSDSEKENESSESESEKSYDGNWKRNGTKKQKFVRPPNMTNYKLLTVEEFCAEKPLRLNKLQKCASVIGEGNDQVENSDMDGNKSNSTDFVSLQTSESRSWQLFPVRKSRNEILDLMPTMAEQSTKLMTLDIPDLRLVPDRIIPKQQSYTYNTNALRARVFSTFRGFRGRRNFHGPRFSGYNPLYNNTNIFPNQMGIRGALLQNQSLTQMFGSDIHSVARGMMQFASALLWNVPQNNQSNGLLPYQQNRSSFNNASAFSQSNFNSRPLFDEPPRNSITPNHIRFSDTSLNNISSGTVSENIEQPFNNRNFRLEHSTISRSSGGDSDFDSCERNFTPPIGRGIRGNRGYHSRRPLSRNNQNQSRFTPSPRNIRSSNSVFPVDPAYIKPDVPLPVEALHQEESDEFIPLRCSTNRVTSEVIDISTEDKFVPRSRGGFGNRPQHKRKRRMKKMGRMAKKKLVQNNSSEDPIVIFLDSPTVSSSYSDDVPVKQEISDVSTVSVKSENKIEQNSSVAVKHEIDTVHVKAELDKNISVKAEGSTNNWQETRVKSEESNEVRVKLEQDQTGSNLRVEINIESSSDTSSGRSLPIASLVKSEPAATVKSESNPSTVDVSSTEIKRESAIGTDTSVVKQESKSNSWKTDIEHSSEQKEAENSEVQRVSDHSSEHRGSENLQKETEAENSEVQRAYDHSSEHRESENLQNETESENPTKEMDTDIPSECEDSGISSEQISTISGRMETDNSTEQMESESIDQNATISGNSVLEDSVVSLGNSASEFERDEEMDVDVSTSNQNCEIETMSSRIAGGVSSSEIGLEDTVKMVKSASRTNKPVTSDIRVNTSDAQENVSSDIRVDLDPSEVEGDLSSRIISDEISRTKQSGSSEARKDNASYGQGSSWAEVKKSHHPLTNFQGSEVKDESDEEEDGDIRPLIKPRHCKTIGTVLSALQIFSPFSPEAPENIPKLKISFDMYLPTDFRKSQRGLPQFRIVVFGGMDPIPSPAQLSELQHRFEDSVPVLRAVVTPDSVVFYTCSDVSLPVDISSYRD
uniref:tRNA-splicing endonuclease subunit Sen54 N-terminal domain-containing protein n=1 Tax=Graphocephala atropunctata TaxID=36148 RepID=A0A1B6M1V8_9HEMI